MRKEVGCALVSQFTRTPPDKSYQDLEGYLREFGAAYIDKLGKEFPEDDMIVLLDELPGLYKRGFRKEHVYIYLLSHGPDLKDILAKDDEGLFRMTPENITSICVRILLIDGLS